MKKFNHLNIPDGWQQYWSRYPQGYTIIEALINWVSQVDDMVDNQNKLTENVKQFRNELDTFIDQFDTNLQGTVTDTLLDWQDSGFLDIVIDQALDTKYHEMDDRLTSQLAQTEQQLIENIKDRSESKGIDIVYDLMLGNDGEVDISNQLNNYLVEGKTYFFPKGEYLFEDKVIVPDNVKLIGSEAVIINDGFRLTGSNIEVDGFKFEGDIDNVIAPSSILIDGGKNITINNNTFDHTKIYGNDFLEGKIQGNLKITNNNFIGDYSDFTGIKRPITLHAYDGLIITGNMFECDVRGSSMVKLQGRVETGVDGVTFIGDQYTKNVVISNNVFKGISSSAISLYDGAGEITISDNIFKLGTPTEMAFRIIDGKNTGTYVNTNKIKNIIFSNNVFEGYATTGGIRLQGGYGMDWEGDEQVAIVTDNIITNHFEGSGGFQIEVSAFHRAIISDNIIDQKNTISDWHSTIGVGGNRTTNISNNIVSDGGILIANDIKTTSNIFMIGEVKKVIVNGNILERWANGAVFFRNVESQELDVVISNNNISTDRTGANAYPIYASIGTTNIRTLIATGNIAHNTASGIAGNRPNLSNATIENYIDENNTWNLQD